MSLSRLYVIRESGAMQSQYEYPAQFAGDQIEPISAARAEELFPGAVEGDDAIFDGMQFFMNWTRDRLLARDPFTAGWNEYGPDGWEMIE